MDFRKHSMLCYKIATKRQYGVTQKRNIQRVRVKVHYPVSPLNRSAFMIFFRKRFLFWRDAGVVDRAALEMR